MKRSKILITGGAGFIGSHLAERLCGDNKVVIFDNLRRNSLKEIPDLKKHRNVKFIKGNMLDKRQVAAAVRDCDTVLHLAAIAGVSSYYNDPAQTLQVNLIGTVNLLECINPRKIKRIVYFSTSEVYGQEAFNAKEESPCSIGPLSDFRWSYAVSKLASENLVVRYGDKYGFQAFSVRPFNIYGPRQTGEGAISNFMRAVIDKKPMIINGDGSPVRAWCYITDCVDAVMRILEKKNLKNGAFNIGNPSETCSTLELAELVRQVIGKDVPISFKKMERTEIKARFPNIDKAKRELGFSPQVDLEEGLELTYQYYSG